MPTTYAHYRFGKDVLNILPSEIQKIINENIELYNIGLHGPDILFYSKPLNKNKINNLGTLLHENKAKNFFENSINIINSINDEKIKNASISYIYGFICHFTLDCSSHNYINKETSQKNISHSEIEAEFDRLLLVMDNLNPIKTKLTKHINPNKHNANVIHQFFNNISCDEIQSTLKSMKFFLNALVAPSKIKRNIIYSLLTIAGKYDDMHGLIINYKPNPDCLVSNNMLLEIYKKRIKKAKDLIISYKKSLNEIIVLDEEFDRNFEA
ncbi:zinc dependent phospholipase C family protein [Clostridium sp. HCP1S3_B4]|uniref:zinc dependent phospholipase C family protein n=1 Tax=unclassified Clostridium TaxID=2614128 RepID=UPI001694CE79|nr:zinc dependent phospholipase C family protein [Clostridiales bacterium]